MPTTTAQRVRRLDDIIAEMGFNGLVSVEGDAWRATRIN
jgi:hypothetical protein